MTLELQSDPATHRIRWTRGVVRRLADSGLIDLEAFELLEGELLRKVKNRRHFAALRRVLAYLRRAFGDDFVQHEMPIRETSIPSEEDDSLPEPDAALLDRPSDSFIDEPPGPGDVRLVIEVADSTVGRDLGVKAGLYARAGIREYWVLDLPRRRLHVHRNPDGATWREVRQWVEDESVAPLADPTATVLVGDILPPSGQAGDAE